MSLATDAERAARVHVGDVGTKFELTVRNEAGALVDCNGTNAFLFLRPDGSLFSRAPTQISTGILRYYGIAGDIDQVGRWQFEAYVQLLDGRKFKTTTKDFPVLDTLG